MGVSVHDGKLLGLVIKKSNLPSNFDQEDILSYIENVIKISKESDAKPICWQNQDASEDWYIGIFWPWSERRIMILDTNWYPLFHLTTDSEQLSTNPNLSNLSQELYKNLVNHFPNLKPEDIALYDARYMS